MDDGPFGDLDPVDPATVWKSEPTEFIPWLASAKRLAHLSRALGLDLEPMAQEAPVGRFRADLVCRDRGSGTGVVIEAQLGPGDHSHLGQLLTYALGLSAGTVVWLTTRFHAEHRVALDGLNEMTDGKIRCFAVAMDLWRIGDSLAAPQFTVFAAPSDWPGAIAAPPGHRPPTANAPIAPAGAPYRLPFDESPIKVRRNRRGLTQRELAEAAGIGAGYLAQIESGTRRGSPETLAAIERALDMWPDMPALPDASPAMKPETGDERRTEA